MTVSIDPALDLKLMRTLHLLLTECSVSRTALILGQSQPAVSSALRRLRAILQDPLLVRSGVKLVPTDRGLELQQQAKAVLDGVERMLSTAEAFDPAECTKRLRIYAANCLGTFFMPRIAELFRKEMPKAFLDFCSVPAESEVFGQLEEGSLDVVIANWPMPRENLRFAPLLETDIVVVVRNDHPLAGRSAITIDEYLALDHLSPTPQSSAALSPIDGHLAQTNVKRKIPVSVHEFTLVPHILAQTDLAFTSSRPFAEQIAQLMPFTIIPAPAELGRMHFYTLWHERAQHSPTNRWLRTMLRRVAHEISEMPVLPDRHLPLAHAPSI